VLVHRPINQPTGFDTRCCLELLLLTTAKLFLILVQDGQALCHPLLQIFLHLAVLPGHSRQPLDLRLKLGRVSACPLGNVLLLLVTTPRVTLRDRTQGRLASLLNISLHVLVITQLSAHGIRSLLGVGLAAVASFFVEVADSGPTSSPRIVIPTDLLVRQIDVRKRNVIVVLEELDNAVPSGSLLASSPSSGGRNPSHEKRLAGINVLLDFGVKGINSHLRGKLPMVIIIDPSRKGQDCREHGKHGP